jgi:16S rRNA (adenine1518-N6/adenine1519-N6)-dimethyltransferase
VTPEDPFVSRNEVKELLDKASVSPKKSLGQNFCCDPQLIQALVRDAELEEGELILEVGTGTGALTRELAKVATRVLSIEIDSGLFRLVSGLLKDEPNVRVFHGDVLKTKNKLNPEFCEAIKEELKAPGIKGVRVIANLPYAIATPLVAQLLEFGTAMRGFTILVQKEAAERFIARSGTKAYGSVSVLIAQWMRGRILRSVPREVFFPRPNVESSVLSLTALEGEEMPSPELYETLKPMVRTLFNSRRKTLNKAAKIAAKCDPSLEKLREAILACEFDLQLRVEDLEPEDFRRLAMQLIEIRDKK